MHEGGCVVCNEGGGVVCSLCSEGEFGIVREREEVCVWCV